MLSLFFQSVVVFQNHFEALFTYTVVYVYMSWI